jgi:RHS repeat-associated protein
VQHWNGNTTTISYDVNSNLTEYTLPAATTVVDTNGYNAADQQDLVSDKAGTTTFYSANYTRDNNNRLTLDSSAPTSQTKFKYTPLNQLCYAGSATTSQCTSPPTGAEPFAYDPADNLVKLNTTTQQFNSADELCWTLVGVSANACSTVPAGATSYAYDTRGNRLSQTPASGAATCDTYDQANRLSTIVTGTGSSCHSPTTVGSYTYNAAGLRMSKAVGGVTTTETWDIAGSLPLLLEDKTSSSTTDYVYGPGGLPLEQVSGTTTLWYHHDQLGSTRAITNGSGVTQATYQYDPYGNTVASTGSVVNPFLYSGQYKDGESGLYYLRARYYDPGAAQFLTRDPMVAQTMPPYAYVAGNPLYSQDPWGLFATTGDENASPGDPWFTWSQAIQDSYIRARGQLQALQNAQVKLQTDPEDLLNSDQASYVDHIGQFGTKKGALSNTLQNLRNLSGGGKAACDELQPFADEVLNFDPVGIRGLPSEYPYGGIDNSRIVPRLPELVPGEDDPVPFEPIIPE